MSLSSQLPEDLMTEVLIRLPVRHLLKCELVCKAWLYQIKSPQFIKLHLNRTATESPRSFIVHSGDPNLEEDWEIELHRNSIEGPEVRDIIHLHWPQPDRDAEGIFMDLGLPSRPRCSRLRNLGISIRVFSSLILNGVANGIVCATNRFEQSIFLWNPATLQSKELPVPIIDHSDHHVASFYSVGFGFDSIADDYKVVKLVMFNQGASVRAEVYSANEICWKEIKVGITFLVNYSNCDICVDGKLYWSAGKNMVTYDLNTEELNNQIELPKVEVTGGIHCRIVDFKDSVALSVHSYGADNNMYIQEISFWNLDDASGKGSWSKKFSFKTFPEMGQLLLHLKNGSIVTRKKGISLELFLYDPNNKQSEYMWLTPQSLLVEGVYTYTESLVLIPGSEPVKYGSTEDLSAEAGGVAEEMGYEENKES